MKKKENQELFPGEILDIIPNSIRANFINKKSKEKKPNDP